LKVETNVMPKIKNLCVLLRLDDEEVLKKARLLLSFYHDIVWGALKNRGANMPAANEKKYNEAVTYLSAFPSSVDEKELQMDLLNKFQAEWYEDLFKGAFNFVSQYKHNSKVYTRILAECYLSEREWTDLELQLDMIIERSSYFKRKKEAVLLFGVALWGDNHPLKAQPALCRRSPYGVFENNRREWRNLLKNDCFTTKLPPFDH